MAVLVVALDLATAREALALVDRLGDAAAWYKIGPRLHVADGPGVVRELLGRGKRVFLDLKWHDIPNTVAGAVEAAAAQGVSLATVHLAGGQRMLAAAAAARQGGLRLVGVGVLTSLGAAEFGAVIGRVAPLPDLLVEQQRLVRLGLEAGLDGYVAAAAEARAIRALAGPDALLVVPGIRRAGDTGGDQVRTATPGEAVQAGADLLVVGRPITGARDPRREALAVVAEARA